MKQSMIIGVLTLAVACTPTHETGEKNVFLVDVSEADTREIKAFEEGGVGCPQSTFWHAHITRYGIISNTEYASITKYELKSQNQYLSNELDRKADIQEYRIQLESLGHKDSMEYQGSLIWRPLWHELQAASYDASMSTTVYLVSDLLENNSWMNLYDPGIRNTLRSNPEAIRKRFKDKALSLKTAEHITVVLVHTPYKQTSENELYAIIVEEIYRPILKECGITVNVQTHI